MIQHAVVFVLFAAAVFYIGRIIYKNFQSKSACGGGCAKCSVDFSKIEQQIQSKKQI